MANRFLTKTEVDEMYGGIAKAWMDAIISDLKENPLPEGDAREYPNPMGPQFVPIRFVNRKK